MGLFSVLYQVIAFYVRLDRWNTDAGFADYLLFFAAGILGGLILIFFPNRQAYAERRWVMMLSFIMASPVAMFFMLSGELLGWFRVILLPQIPGR